MLALYGIPKVALVPLFILWFGIGVLPKVVMVAMICVFIVLINTIAGLRSLSPQLIAALRILGAGRVAILRHVVLPHTLPFILAALRISLPTALAGAVLAELLSAGTGIGYLISQAADYLDSAQVMALVITLAAIVLAFRLLLTPIERWVTRFHLAEEGMR